MAFPSLQPNSTPTNNHQEQPTLTVQNDEIITNTTVIQQAIDSAFKKAYKDASPTQNRSHARKVRKPVRDLETTTE
jgi:hypothetical protein